ncbi:MAG: hypothetical protein WAZ18_01945 [Alphaproteobacteria bacterium]
MSRKARRATALKQPQEPAYVIDKYELTELLHANQGFKELFQRLQSELTHKTISQTQAEHLVFAYLIINRNVFNLLPKGTIHKDIEVLTHEISIIIAYELGVKPTVEDINMASKTISNTPELRLKPFKLGDWKNPAGKSGMMH